VLAVAQLHGTRLGEDVLAALGEALGVREGGVVGLEVERRLVELARDAGKVVREEAVAVREEGESV